jgi:hypothetical protein
VRQSHWWPASHWLSQWLTPSRSDGALRRSKLFLHTAEAVAAADEDGVFATAACGEFSSSFVLGFVLNPIPNPKP